MSLQQPAEEENREHQDETTESEYDPTRTVGLLVITSVVEFIAAVVACNQHDCTSSYAFAVSLGVLSCISTIGLLGILKFCEPEGAAVQQVAPLLGLFLPLLWTLGVAVLTFHRPFNVVGNGYLATWFAFFLSFNHLTNASQQAKQHVQRMWQRAQATVEEQKCVMLLYLGSLVVTCEALTVCYEEADYSGSNGWALAAGMVSSVLAASYLFAEQTVGRYAPVLSVFLAVWWTPGAIVLTFRNPFTSVGNGFFGSWGSLIGACLFANHATYRFDYSRSMARMHQTSEDAEVFDDMAAEELATSNRDLESLTHDRHSTDSSEPEEDFVRVKADFVDVAVDVAEESAGNRESLSLDEIRDSVHSAHNTL